MSIFISATAIWILIGPITRLIFVGSFPSPWWHIYKILQFLSDDLIYRLLLLVRLKVAKPEKQMTESCIPLIKPLPLLTKSLYLGAIFLINSWMLHESRHLAH